MSRIPSSTQAMFELERLLSSISDIELRRTGKFWELWMRGDDEVEVSDPEDAGYYPSYRIATVKINPQGAIRSFEGIPQFAGRSVLQQLILLLDRIDHSVSNIRVDLRPNGQLIDVDVVTVEDVCEYDESGGCQESTTDWIVGRFAYDPGRELLLHRA